VVNFQVYIELNYVKLTVTVRIISNGFSLNLSEASICGLFFVRRNRAYSDVNENESAVLLELCISCNKVFQVKYKHDIYQCRMYSGELLMMGRETDRNM